MGLSDGSASLHDLNSPEKALCRWKVGAEALGCLTVLGRNPDSPLATCFLGVSRDGWMKMVDFRSKQTVWEERLNPLKGVVSALTLGHEPGQVVVGTQRGFLEVFDVGKRLFIESFLLQREGECLPVLDVQGFVPTSSFKNMRFNNTLDKKNRAEVEGGRKDHFLLTYPSHFSEFSVFSLRGAGVGGRAEVDPLLHFQAENQTFSNSYMRSKRLPRLTRLDSTHLVDVNYQLNTEGLMLSKRLLNVQNLLEKDKALYTDILKGNLEYLVSASKLSLMQEQLAVPSAFERQAEFFNSLTASLVVPSLWQPVADDFFFDNLVLTAGQDRNLRFLNLGNEFKYKRPMSEEFKGLKCYLLSAADFKRRSYFYHYSGRVCMVRESFHLPKANAGFFSDFDGFSQAFGITNLESEVYESGLSQAHLYNYGRLYQTRTTRHFPSVSLWRCPDTHVESTTCFL